MRASLIFRSIKMTTPVALTVLTYCIAIGGFIAGKLSAFSPASIAAILPLLACWFFAALAAICFSRNPKRGAFWVAPSLFLLVTPFRYLILVIWMGLVDGP